MRREYLSWWSPQLQRSMELLIFGHAGARVIVFPTRGGRFYDYENWGLINALSSSIARGLLQLYCVDSIDRESLYARHRPPHERIERHRQYEAYILDEVLPLTRERNPDPTLIVHGCSMGAYHALTLALRHPDRVGKVVALSGRYDLTTPIGNYRDLFDGHYDQTIYYFTPCHFIPQLTCPQILAQMRQMQIIIAVGATDVFLENNRQLSTSLWQKGIWHAFDIWPGEAHAPHDWQQMVKVYL